MAQLDIKALREALATRLTGTPGVAQVHAFMPNRLAGLPCVIVTYSDSPITISPQRYRVDHRLQIAILITAYSKISQGSSDASALLDAVINRLINYDTGIILSVGSDKVVIRPTSQRIPDDPYMYGGQAYAHAIVAVEVADIRGETFKG